MKLFALVLAGTLALAGCASRPPGAILVVNDPAQAFKNGLWFLDHGDPRAALAEFERARRLDPNYTPAWSGIALARAEQGEFPEALAALERARTADSPWVRQVAIRVLTRWQGPNWLQRAEEEFEAGRRLDPRDAGLDVTMGRAYMVALHFEQAATLFRRVLILGRGDAAQATAELDRLEEIRRAAPRTAAGRRIALSGRLTRGELAALLMNEFRSPKPPGEAEGKPALDDHALPPATDLDRSPYRAEIEGLLRNPPRGLFPFPDRTFGPERPVTRAELALVLEDLWRRAGTAEAQPPPLLFSDLSPGHYAAGPARQLLAARILDLRADGRFAPNEAVSGVEALLALRRLEEVIGAVRQRP